ncbi:DUF4873 domain-containing protein [Actinoplanes sp. NPDC049265]|uniref:DUF4873 domain-containing protein n=1 Tax=Actinoplanes sp. NPDC049265 TaxID=3363902 RepID=UPI0037164A1A
MSEDYRGPAVVTVGDSSASLDVRLSAHFEPLEGRLRWAGRIAPDAALVAAYRAGFREATITVADGSPASAKVGEPDPWGGLRLSGIGFPPWPDFS